jgi:hypothetical protein
MGLADAARAAVIHHEGGDERSPEFTIQETAKASPWKQAIRAQLIGPTDHRLIARQSCESSAIPPLQAGVPGISVTVPAASLIVGAVSVHGLACDHDCAAATVRKPGTRVAGPV